jgi:hypothetical protein
VYKRQDDYLDLAVIETETANDVATGEWRRREVVRTLRKLAACLAALA